LNYTEGFNMAIGNLEGADIPNAGAVGRPQESAVSAVSWPAITAGTVVAVSVTFVLTALGSGLGIASVSPWPGRGVSATTFTVLTAIWVIVVQWGASALGGYTAGRLRTKWAGLHTHEVFFRDTAHGLVTWATATVLGALLFTAAAVHTAGKGVHAAAALSSVPAERDFHRSMGRDGTASYGMDRLFRSTSTEPVAPERYAEATRLLNNAVADGTLSTEDNAYLTGLVAARAAIPPQEAQQRVNDALAQLKAADVRARKAADAARVAAAETSIYLALSMLVGAFVACAAAALGGKLRDLHP
jgi:hypothetical protein